MTEKGDTLSAVQLLNRFFIKTWNKSSNDLRFSILLNQQDLGLLRYHLNQFNLFVNKHPEVYKPENTYIINAASYAKFGEFDRANEYFDKAISLYPFNGWIYFYKGRMFLRMGRKKEAIRQFRKSDELGVNEAREALKKIK